MHAQAGTVFHPGGEKVGCALGTPTCLLTRHLLAWAPLSGHPLLQGQAPALPLMGLCLVQDQELVSVARHKGGFSRGSELPAKVLGGLAGGREGMSGRKEVKGSPTQQAAGNFPGGPQPRLPTGGLTSCPEGGLLARGHPSLRPSGPAHARLRLPTTPSPGPSPPSLSGLQWNKGRWQWEPRAPATWEAVGIHRQLESLSGAPNPGKGSKHPPLHCPLPEAWVLFGPQGGQEGP